MRTESPSHLLTLESNKLPPTDESAFGKAQARIQIKKVHEPDTNYV